MCSVHIYALIGRRQECHRREGDEEITNRRPSRDLTPVVSIDCQYLCRLKGFADM